jgi:hypothetical protein
MVEMKPVMIDEQCKYLHKLCERYCKANRKKRCLLVEMQVVSGLHRKSLIRILTGRLYHR